MAVYDDRKERTLGNQESLNSENSLIPQGMSVEGAGHTLANEAANFLAGQEGLQQPLSNEHEDKPEKSAKSESPEGLNAAEAAASGDGATSGPLTATEADKVGKGFTGDKDTTDNRTGRQRFLAGALFGAGAARKQKSKGKSKKKWLIFGALGGVGLIGLILFLIFLLGSLMIPDFATHITEYEFARVVRTFAEQDMEITSEKAAVDSANDGLYSSIKSTYQNLRDNTWGKLEDQYSPQKVINNLETDGKLSFNYKSGVLGRQTLNGVTFDGVSHDLNTGFFFGKLHPLQNFQQQVTLASEFGTALNESLRDRGIGIIIRGSVEKRIRQELGINLVAWTIGKYQGKTEAEAEAEIEQDAYKTVDDQNGIAATKDGQLQNTESKAAEDEQQAVSNTDGIKQIVANDGAEPQSVVNDIVAGASGGVLSKVTSFFSSSAAIAVPVCMIWSGSLGNSGSAIDAQDAELQRSYYFVASAADQQKAGATNAEAVGATSWKLGNITQSNPEIRASGGTVDTSDEISPEASSSGQLSSGDIFTTLFGSVAGGALSSFAGSVCPALTSTAGLGIQAVASIGLAIATLGTGEGINEVVTSGINELIPQMVTKFTTKEGLKDLAKTTARDGALIVGGTLLAKLIVATNAGVVNNGLATGVAFDNAADAGGNLNANQDMQTQFYGAPMTDAETAQSDQEDQQYIADQTKTKNIDQRYFALSNPDSLFSRLATGLYGTVYGSSQSIFGSLDSLMGKITNPFAALSHFFDTLDGHVFAAASDTSVSQYYGNVQFGWTPAEENLIETNPSYQPLENTQYFDDNTTPTEAQDIANAYSKCFGRNPDGSLNSTYTVGYMLANNWIIRDSNGDIVPDHGDCSPDNLGPNNSQYGDLVFRWRLMNSYNATTDQLIDVGNVGSASS